VVVDDEARGVEETAEELVRLMREVRGVGAPICDFFGVSAGLLRLLELTEDDAEERSDLAAPDTGLSTRGRR
jgi:hypothetical protein